MITLVMPYEITVYRDTPKRGETDAKWCFYISHNGHVWKTDTGYETEDKAKSAAMMAYRRSR